jgi:hypothetical protein
MTKVVCISTLGWNSSAEEKIKDLTKATIQMYPLWCRRGGKPYLLVILQVECCLQGILKKNFFSLYHCGLKKIVVFCTPHAEIRSVHLSVRTLVFIQERVRLPTDYYFVLQYL